MVCYTSLFAPNGALIINPCQGARVWGSVSHCTRGVYVSCQVCSLQCLTWTACSVPYSNWGVPTILLARPVWSLAVSITCVSRSFAPVTEWSSSYKSLLA